MKSYKILLVCSGGMSTSVLMSKMQKYGEENGIDVKVDACGTNKYMDEAAGYDIILLGPQIAYRKAQRSSTHSAFKASKDSNAPSDSARIGVESFVFSQQGIIS